MSVTIDTEWIATQLGCLCIVVIPLVIAALVSLYAALHYRVVERGTKEGDYYD